MNRGTCQSVHILKKRSTDSILVTLFCMLQQGLESKRSFQNVNFAAVHLPERTSINSGCIESSSHAEMIWFSVVSHCQLDNIIYYFFN
jgi:hypothetical protein